MFIVLIIQLKLSNLRKISSQSSSAIFGQTNLTYGARVKKYLFMLDFRTYSSTQTKTLDQHLSFASCKMQSKIAAQQIIPKEDV